jgi:hypothetical protein
MPPIARKGDFVLVSRKRSYTEVHSGTLHSSEWEPGVVANVTRQGDIRKAFIGLGAASDVSRMPRQIVTAKEIPGGDAFALVRVLRELAGTEYPTYESLMEARSEIKKAFEVLKAAKNPRRVRVRRRVVAASARKQARRTARGRVARRRNSPADAKPVRAFVLSNVRVEFFQGYAQNVFYLRESDGKPYQHRVETDAAELYLCSHPDFGHCLLIVDPSGRTPLWK